MCMATVNYIFTHCSFFFLCVCVHIYFFQTFCLGLGKDMYNIVNKCIKNMLHHYNIILIVSNQQWYSAYNYTDISSKLHQEAEEKRSGFKGQSLFIQIKTNLKKRAMVYNTIWHIPALLCI